MHRIADEAMRYLGAGGDGASTASGQALRAQVEKTLAELSSTPPRYTLTICEVQPGALVSPAGQRIPTPGTLAQKLLDHCESAAALVCTLGADFDAKLLQLQHRSMADAVILDACGSAWVEHGCDEAEIALRSKFPGKHFTARFSPGYGDLPLQIQPDFLTATSAMTRLGVTVNDRCLMSPRKTVTAIIGISDAPMEPSHTKNCAACPLREGCIARESGRTCTEERINT